MQAMDELRKRQKTITGDFKARSEKAERILGEIEECETKLAAMSESLSTVLLMDVIQAAVAVKAPKAKAAKVKAARTAKATAVKPAVKPTAGPSLKNIVRDFLAKAGKPMKIADIVQGMQKAGHVFQATKPVVAMRFLIYNNKKMFKRVKRGTFAAVAANVQQAKAAKVAKPLKVKPANAKPVAKTVAPTLRDSVREFLLKAGKPMKIAEIVLAMQKAGHVFQAKRPVAAMSLLLYSNKKVFKKVKPGTFAVMAAPVLQAKAAKVAKTAKVKPAVKPNESASLKDSVRGFMLKAGKPMKIAEIVQAMQKAGHVFESKKPVKAMTKLMYNNAKVFKRVKPGTFKAV